MGFDVTQLTQDEEQSLFTIKTNIPIPMLVYGDSFQWAKYGHHIIPSSLDLKNHNKGSFHWTFWNSFIEFLRIRWKSIFHLEFSYCFQAGSLFWGTVRFFKQRQKFWSTFVEWKKKRSLHQWDSWHCIVSNTDSPIHIHDFFAPEVWKAFNVGINAWNITAVLHSSGDTIWWISPFCWRSFHIYVKV